LKIEFFEIARIWAVYIFVLTNVECLGRLLGD
jgi:hypothetical protein